MGEDKRNTENDVIGLCDGGGSKEAERKSRTNLETNQGRPVGALGDA